MLLLALLMVEEDIFKPELPAPEVEPRTGYVGIISDNWINLGINHDYLHLISFKFSSLKLRSKHFNDFEEVYNLDARLDGYSYGLHLTHRVREKKLISELKMWKWFYYNSNLLTGWTEGIYNRDTIMYTGGIRFYHDFPTITVGGWSNYRKNFDAGVILQLKGFRLEFGKERKCGGFIHEQGSIKAGRFRDFYPFAMFPLEDIIPEILNFHGVKINTPVIELTSGRWYYYSSMENDKFVWEKGETYFALLKIHLKPLSLSVGHKTRGILKNFACIQLEDEIGWLGFNISAEGSYKPDRFVSGGLSIWLNRNISPFISVNNISYSPDIEMKYPDYYVGFHFQL